MSLIGSTWHDGVVVACDDDAWASVVPTFLGGGFRITVLPGPEPLAHARAQADRLAGVLGTRLDHAAWQHLVSQHLVSQHGAEATDVVGGWAHAVGAGFGEPWTRIAAPRPDAVVGPHAADLPWTYASDSPTAGLPMISPLEADLAARYLAEQRTDVGLWWNVRDELCATTAGNVLLRMPDGAWLRPASSSGVVPTWAHDAEADRLGAMPAVLTRDVVAAGSLSIVTARGDLQRLGVPG